MLHELLNLFKQLGECIEHDSHIICEESSITYYELRRLMAMLFKSTKDKVTKKVLGDILKALTVMELKNKPVPTMQKLKSISPNVFGE